MKEILIVIAIANVLLPLCLCLSSKIRQDMEDRHYRDLKGENTLSQCEGEE